MIESRINGRLPERVGLFIERAIIESRRPMNKRHILPSIANIKKARVTVMSESRIENLDVGESFEIWRRKLLIGRLRTVGGKCQGNNSHHVFRYYVNDLVILPVS